MQQQHERPHYISAFETDISGCWKLSSAFNLMQELAGEHAVQLRLGQRDLLPYNVVWVLTKVYIEMYKYPLFDETIRAKTWYTPPQRLTFDRFFEFCRTDGTVLGAASSSWVFMDAQVRRVVRPQSIPIDFPALPLPLSGLPVPGRIRMEAALSYHSTRSPLYSDIDLNGHLNNARYVDWICDMFPAEIYHRRHIARLNINYAHEVLPDQAVALHLADEGGGFTAAGYAAAQTVFEARGAFA